MPEPVKAKRPIGLPKPQPGAATFGWCTIVRPPPWASVGGTGADSPPAAAGGAVDDEAVRAGTSTDFPTTSDREKSPYVGIAPSTHPSATGTKLSVPVPPDVPPEAPPVAEAARGSLMNGGVATRVAVSETGSVAGAGSGAEPLPVDRPPPVSVGRAVAVVVPDAVCVIVLCRRVRVRCLRRAARVVERVVAVAPVLAVVLAVVVFAVVLAVVLAVVVATLVT
jgi:hypothetical protein